jgi:hypothetical protein
MKGSLNNFLEEVIKSAARYSFMAGERGKWETIEHELKHHVPFTLSVSILAGVIVGFLYLRGYLGSSIMGTIFEVVHPAHVLFSAAAASAIYMKYHRSLIRAMSISVLGAILIGTLSDVLLPWVAGKSLGFATELHMPILEEPFLILGVAIVGAYFGKYSHIFLTSHSSHIFLSIFASLSYLLAFSSGLGVAAMVLITVIVFLVVYIPCCFGDIVFPILFMRHPCKKCGYWHEH